MSKPPARRKRILFVNAVNEVTRERAQSFLTDEHIEKIVKAYRGFRDVEGFARVVPIDEIRGNDHNLSIALYVRPSANRVAEAVAEYGNSLAQAIKEWQRSSAALRKSMDELFDMLKEVGLGQGK